MFFRQKIGHMTWAAPAVLAVIATAAVAQDYPERDVTMIVQSSPGGGSDIIARTVAGIIQEKGLLPTGLLVENRPGGGGAIAYNFIAQRQRDPYYLGIMATSFFVAPLMGQSPAKISDFTPVSVVAADPFVLVVEANSTIQSLDDIRQMSSVRIGNTGPVTDPALLAASLRDELGVQVRAVPFNGDGEVTTALLGGHIDLQFGNASEVMAQLEAGRVRPIAVTSSERLEALPDTPTFKELGVGIELMLYRGFMMSADVPPEAVAFWEDVLRQVSESPEWDEQYIRRNNSFPLYLDSEQFAAEIPKISARYEAYLREIQAIQ